MPKTWSFTENDIRPRRLMEEKQACLEADRAFLLSRKSYFVSVSCPACDATEACFLFEKFGFSYVECHRCGTWYMNPRPSPDMLQAFYASSQNYAYWNRYIFPASEDVRRQRIFYPRATRLAEFCQGYHVTTGAFLEIGAGFGTFCEEVRALKLFSTIYALEPTPDLAASCRQRGLNVLECPLEHMPPGIEVDVIAAFEVIEHVFSPPTFVRECVGLLRPGGLLVLTCPNCRGFDVTMLKTLSNTIDHEHLNYFHIESLPLLLRRCGLEVREVQTPGRLDAELVRKHVLSGAFDLNAQPWLQRILVDRWDELHEPFQDFLASHRLSSHMWVVAQKTIC